MANNVKNTKLNKGLNLKLLLIFLVLLWLFPLVSKSIVLHLNYSVFKKDDKSGYVELYFKIPVSTISLTENENAKFQASLSVEISFLQNNKIVLTDFYNLLSPELMGNKNTNLALLELKRYVLPYGNYSLQINISDNNEEGNQTNFNSEIAVSFPHKNIDFSTIELADTIYQYSETNEFSRNGKKVIPNVTNFYYVNKNSLQFYVEFYNAKDFIDSKILYAKYYLIKDSAVLYSTANLTKQLTLDLNYINGTIQIKDLSLGQYQLVVEIINTKNQKIATKTSSFSIIEKSKKDYTLEIDKIKFFKKLLSSYTYPELKNDIDYLYFISTRKELQTAVYLEKHEDSASSVNFLYKFWIVRDSIDPARAWLTHLKKSNTANEIFGTQLRKGYLTDRGRVFMEYGKPNHIIESKDASIAYPYQIWQYYHLSKTQQNKKFVFFNRTGALDEFELLHSDATGEPKNENWKQVINKFNHNNNFKDNIWGDYLEDDFNW